MPLTKVTSSLINTVSASQITATGATAGQVLTYNGSTSTWVASAAPNPIKAWVNFDGTKDTIGTTSTSNTNRLIRSSYNVSSVLRSGTGDYTVNFTTPMSNANYCAQVTGEIVTGNNSTDSSAYIENAGISTASIRVRTGNCDTAVYFDFPGVHVTIIGN